MRRLVWLVVLSVVALIGLAGPAAAVFGVEETMIGAGVLAALVFVAFLLVPGVREPERWGAEERPAEGVAP